MLEQELIDIFKVMVVKEADKLPTPFLDNAEDGYITDFKPTIAQERVLNSSFRPLNIITLFTVEERENADLSQLLIKQILHYVEVYGLDTPGLFDLEVNNGKCVSLAYIRGVTRGELGDMVREVIYRNAPIKKVAEFKKIIDQFDIDYDLNKVANNELRVLLYREQKDRFESGDDAVRHIVYSITDDSLLIKSPKVISDITVGRNKISNRFLEKHEVPLAKVFNRHKKLIMALKHDGNKSIINKISRLSKTLHVPIKEGINKTFIAKALSGGIYAGVNEVLSQISVRDKFKYLNLLEYKLLQSPLDVFVIRNGKIHLEKNRKQYGIIPILDLKNKIAQSLVNDLGHLVKKNILLDEYVDYGLPISQKQTFGNLPFGTKVTVDGDHICSGVYWENDWGARDLDLSTVDTSGIRTGWGMYSGYSRSNPITYSGDVTSARNGAMEFMTSSVNYEDTYGLFLNVFAGEVGCETELVVGSKSKDRWIKNPIIREKSKLNSKQTILGFVRDGKFIVYNCRVSNSRVSGGEINKTLIGKGLASMITTRTLFDDLGISYDTVRDPNKVYDFDLTYSGFSLDKLEGMLYNN